jgi:hypothetical protein
MLTKAIETPKWKRKPKKVWSYAKEAEQFEGEYIAVVGDMIIAHGQDACVVMDEAEKYHERPVLAMIPRGGWAQFL